MSPSKETQPITKANLDNYLKDLAKEYRKLAGKNMPAEIVLTGGAAVLAEYGFRELTYDVDAIIVAASAMKSAIARVSDKHNLPHALLNPSVGLYAYVHNFIMHIFRICCIYRRRIVLHERFKAVC